MPSRYTVVQFVPNPISDERINIGVIAYDEGTVRGQFLGDWRRVRSFGGESVEFLRDFATRFHSEITRASFSDALPDRLTPAALDALAGRFSHSIQFTEARASLHSVDALIHELAPLVLPESTARSRRPAAKTLAARRLFDVVDALINDRAVSSELVRKGYPLNGERREHVFDVAVANGIPYLAAQTVSFDSGVRIERRGLQNRLDAIAWTIEDTRRRLPELPLAVMAVHAKEDSEEFGELEDLRRSSAALYSELGAEVVDERSLARWGDNVLRASLPRPEQRETA
jgi:hypothetical protein